ncbi:hypothetical protein ACVWY2_002784 [Bradyrhizobium sp. JR6.1]
MIDVDRPVARRERRRLRPFNPFEMKRHGLSLSSLPGFTGGPFA